MHVTVISKTMWLPTAVFLEHDIFKNIIHLFKHDPMKLLQYCFGFLNCSNQASMQISKFLVALVKYKKQFKRPHLKLCNIHLGRYITTWFYYLYMRTITFFQSSNITLCVNCKNYCKNCNNYCFMQLSSF